jgi:hypothetical protein
MRLSLALVALLLLLPGLAHGQERLGTPRRLVAAVPPGGGAPSAPHPAVPGGVVEYRRPASATDALETPAGYRVWVDRARWKAQQSTRSDGLFLLTHMRGEAWVVVATDVTPAPMAALKQLALEHARKVATDVRLTREEWRWVNGLEVLCLQFDATVQGIPLTYFGYYHSHEKGTIQLLAYARQQRFGEFQGELAGLLNGLVLSDTE